MINTKIAFILLMTLVWSSCIKTKWSKGTQLVTINGTDDNDTWEETFTYNDQGQLVEFNDHRSLGRRYEMEYKDGHLLQYRTYRMDTNRVIFRDSFSYDTDGRIKRIYSFSINHGPGLSLDHIYVFEYDDDDNVKERKYYRAGDPEYRSRKVYHWDGDKIEQVDDYWYGDLDHEWYYKYDHKKNYKKDIPIYKSNPLNWQDHNIRKMEVRDYSGLLDISCYSCKTTYKYNLDGYPVKIVTDWGAEYELVYE